MVYRGDLLSLIIKTSFWFESLTPRSSNILGEFNEQGQTPTSNSMAESHCLGSEPKHVSNQTKNIHLY